MRTSLLRLAIIGGGPAALLLYKRLVDEKARSVQVDIFEAQSALGQGMPYSTEGASREHVTNVSADELPEMTPSLTGWIRAQPAEDLEAFGLDADRFSEKNVLPRLLFGKYLEAQFHGLLEQGRALGIVTRVHFETRVADIRDDPKAGHVVIETQDGATAAFDRVVICTGHEWPRDDEDAARRYFASPYPPEKLAHVFDHPVAIRGSSLTAIDAIRTLARHNGSFERDGGKLVFKAAPGSGHFRIVMHSRHGLLPCIRVHMDDPHVAGSPLITDDAIERNRRDNNGFLSLDFLFEDGFKKGVREKDAAFYAIIRDMTLEQFVETMMAYRENADPFALFAAEEREADRSIQRERPVYWKEMLAALSFAMNYPAKHLSAEDMLRLQKVLMPLISVVIAFVPQSSVDEMMALHDAGRLDIVDVGADGRVEARADGGAVFHYKGEDGRDCIVPFETFVDCIGQRHLTVQQFPFRTLAEDGTVTGARVKFRSAAAARSLLDQGQDKITEVDGAFYLQVPGVAISDHFQLIGKDGRHNDRLFIMAVPHIGGFNPDYSGLDFCEHASELIVEKLLS